MPSPAAERWTAQLVLRALYRHYSRSGWAMLTEVVARLDRETAELARAAHRAGTIDGAAFKVLTAERRIDALLVRKSRRTGTVPAPVRAGSGPDPQTSAAVETIATLFDLDDEAVGVEPPVSAVQHLDLGDDGGIERLAVEVKVTRADFLGDVRNPQKQAPWRGLAHRHAYATPPGLVRPGELPAGSGLIEVDRGRGGGLTARWHTRAPSGNRPGPLPLANIMDAFWRASRLEAAVKGYEHSALVAEDEIFDPDALRGRLERLQAELDRVQKRLDREHELRTDWQLRYGLLDPPPCATCGEPLKPRKSGYHGLGWKHLNTAADTACEQARRAAAEERNAALPEDRQDPPRYLYVPPAEPVEVLPADATHTP